ncbi:hypothetical protein L1049_006949 [Liquidambar formosana]|uniref:3-ketoacyl-CoA synthase n=1 Tax=Liquidambar formosana TaxID=63359 RepID=A0AAP0WUE2_LIQFO
MFVVTFTFNDLLEFMYHSNPNSIALRLCLTLVVILSTLYIVKPSRKVFLLDFACYKPKDTQASTNERVLKQIGKYGKFTEESMDFMKKMMGKSGLGQSTYLPDALLKECPNPCMKEAREEAEEVMFGAIDELLRKTRVKSEDIGILVVNCSIFNVVPSLSAMIVARYKLGENVRSYNLGGMGCSAGLMAIGLAKQLLLVHHNCYALVVSTENISQNCYIGNNPPMLFANCLFRVGGAAILLSNRPSDRRSSKYQLIHTVHTNTASSDRSYHCIYQEEDLDGQEGLNVTKDLMDVAIRAIASNITTLGRLVLPVSEQLRFLANYLIRYFHVAKIEPYIPKFKNAFDHFFPHVGGKPVLDGLQRNLGFSEAEMEASRMTLYRFGNTSSSSVWYQLAYSEAKGRIKRGNLVWQLAFGSGFKCTSAVWRALRTVDHEEGNPWRDEIHQFPVDLRNIGSDLAYFEPVQKDIAG